MGYQAASLQNLADQFARLPGIGRKTAQRLAYHILSLPPERAEEFASAILEARKLIQRCRICQNLSDTDTCSVCSDPNRDPTILCVVEDPRDVAAFEKTREFHGLYHVLHGLISPINGIGPDQICVKELLARLSGPVREVIMATNPTVEGEATAMYLARLIQPMGLTVTRLAYGIPVGGNLEYADEVTLYRALEGRIVIH